MKRIDQEHWRAREVSRLLALVESERRYFQEIVAVLPIGVAVLDRDASFISANRTFRKIFSLAARNLAALQLTDLFPGAEMTERVAEVFETGAAQHNLILEHVTAEGARALRVSVQPFRGWEEEADSEVLLVVQDLEAHPDISVAVGGGEILKNLEAVLWERDAKTMNFISVTGGAAEILGIPASGWMEAGDFIAERIHPDDREWVRAFYRSTVSAAAIRSCEYRALTVEGETVWLRDMIHVDRNESGEPVKLSGITVDVNTRKLRDEQLVQAEKMAALGRLAGKITHDSNNLLMIVLGYAEDLLDTLPEDHPGRADLTEIISAAERLTGLTGELLNFTRRHSLSPREFNLNTLIESFESALRRELGEKIALQLRLGQDAGLVRADWDRLDEAILTLARRARRVMAQGGRLLMETANLELADGSPRTSEVLPPGSYVTLTITDTGAGLDEESRTRLFEPFFAGRAKGQDLPSVYTVIRENGGDIRVTSAMGGGTCFTIFLPRIDRALTGPAASPEPARTAAAPRAAVLLAEDESGIRALIQKILERQGYQVLVAGDGEEAIRVAAGRSKPVDLLLADVMMPVMGGRELAEKLRQGWPDLKVLFISGYTGEDLLSEGALPPGSAFIQKPFSLASLLNQVREALAG